MGLLLHNSTSLGIFQNVWNSFAPYIQPAIKFHRFQFFSYHLSIYLSSAHIFSLASQYSWLGQQTSNWFLTFPTHTMGRGESQPSRGIEKVPAGRNGVEARANGACSLGTSIISQDCSFSRASGPYQKSKGWLGTPDVPVAKSANHSMGSGWEILFMFPSEYHRRRNTTNQHLNVQHH